MTKAAQKETVVLPAVKDPELTYTKADKDGNRWAQAPFGDDMTRVYVITATGRQINTAAATADEAKDLLLAYLKD